MGLKLVNISIIVLIFSFCVGVQAEALPKAGMQTFTESKDYYKNSYGYNTKDACRGVMCLPAQTEVSCIYSYKKGPDAGTKLQVCAIKTMKTPGSATTDVSGSDFSLVTGIVGKDGEIKPLPKGDVFQAGFWGVKKFERSAVDPFTAPCGGGGTEGGVCIEQSSVLKDPDPCKGSGMNAGLICIGKDMEALYNDSNPLHLFDKKEREKVGKAFSAMKFGPLCEGFIKPDGELGLFGKKFIESFKKVCHHCFFGEKPIDVKAICPKFSTFSDAKKEYFWAWVGGSMAFPESSCRTVVRAKGVKIKGHQEYAVGIVQLEESFHRRKYRGEYCATDPGQSLYDLTFQFECAASIIKTTRYDVGKPLWGSTGRFDQYWQKLKSLNGKGGKISQYISKFPGCN